MYFLWKRVSIKTYIICFFAIVGFCFLSLNSNFHVVSNTIRESGYLENLGISQDVYLERLKRYNTYQTSEHLRRGPGEGGVGVVLSSEDADLAKKEFKDEAFNRRASDKVSLDRSLPDMRMPECLSLTYSQDLPTASVIIIFHNEAWSTLLRTAHSTVNRSPPRLLKEVILLDDASYKTNLGAELDAYIKTTWPDGIVRVERHKTRLGLIRARLEGARVATGDVIIFLDSHCECTKGWLEPLLQRIHDNPSVSIVPMVDIIGAQDIAYNSIGLQVHNTGTFWWSMHFTWSEIPEKERRRRKRDTDPVRSPTMLGGLFAMSRDYFYKVGSYDDGMEIWGGENLELSFRVWMCGGSMEIIPCSRVGHIFRPYHPYTFPGNKDYHGINSKRLAEVWMDEYKRLFYMQRSDLLNKEYGDISSRVKLRKELRCKSFQWYLDNVIPDKFIPDRNVSAFGTLRNPSTNLCVDLLNQIEFDRGYLTAGLYQCQGGKSGRQIFSLTFDGTIRREWGCLSAITGDTNVKFINCQKNRQDQVWKHNQNVGTIVNAESGRCLDTVSTKGILGTLKGTRCIGRPSQKWVFETYFK